MGNLTNEYINQTYPSLVKFANSYNGVSSSLQNLQDGIGDNLPIQISTTTVNISGSFLVNGQPVQANIDTGSFATTGSNVFNGNQIITGSVNITGNYLINGSPVIGSQGPQGPTGPTGAQGNQGNTGVQGPQGNTGVQGSQGNQGNTGVQGAQGNQGNTGVQGAQGNQGNVGPQGNQGNTGLTGPTGPQGNQGDIGPQGNQGNVGAQGNQGNTGPQGNQGNTGAQGNQGDIGPQGNQGATGPTPSFDSGSYATTGSNTFNGNQIISGTLNVTGALTASGLDYPTVDGVADQFMSTDGAGNLTFDWVKTLHQNIHNAETSSIVRGTPLFVSGATGDNANVYIADAGNPLRRPATLIAYDNTLAPAGTGTAIISGEIQGVNTTGYPAGTVIYLAAGGGWTNVRPTGSSSVQVLGVVTRENNNGRGIVFNQVADSLPNLPSDNIWLGDVNGVPQAIDKDTLGFAITGSNQFSGSQEITGALTLVYYDQPYDTYFKIAELGAPSGDYFQFNSNLKVDSGNLTVGGDIKGNFITDKDGSNPLVISGSQGVNIIGDTNVTGGLNVTGEITALSASITYLETIYQTSSVLFSSGSNILGDESGDTQTLWGTVKLPSGPLSITGSVDITGQYYINGSPVIGPQGPQGPIGPQGNQGNTGAQGNQGNVGPTGPQGNQGDTGAQGNTGAQGDIGPQGNQGNIGPIGPQGNQGNTGAQGNQGNTGSQGDTGAQGNQGNTGPIGPQGNQGDTGATGPQGNQGNTGAQGNQGNTGPIGPQGNQGNTGAQGDIGPQGNQGNTGPIGPQGNQGNTGATGPQGNQGNTGAQGDIGVTGPQGNQGNTGGTGPQGNQGNTGAQGPIGPTPSFDSGSYAITGSNQFSGSQEITGALTLVYYDAPFNSYFKIAELGAPLGDYFQFNSNVKIDSGNLTVGGDFKNNFITDKDGTNILVISGSQGLNLIGNTEITGGLNISGSININNTPTSSLILGQGSGAVSLENSGNGLNVITDQQRLVVNNNGVEVTGSLNVTDGITGSLLGTSSYATNALTASFALNGGGGGSAFPYTGSAIITGSLNVIGTLNVSSGSYLETDGITNAGPGENIEIAPRSAANVIVNVQNTTDKFIVKSQSGGAIVDITGSLNVTNGITGSLLGTASYATNALTASFALNGGGGGSAFPYTGSAVITGSLSITGSINGSVNALSISSNTASLNLSNGDFFTLQLVSGSNTFINPSNIKAGQTINMLLSTTGSATVSFPTTVKQAGSFPYIPTPTTSKDIITLVSFDGTNLYLSNVKNLI